MMKKAIKAGLEWKKFDLLAFKFKNSYFLFKDHKISKADFTVQFLLAFMIGVNI